MPMIDATRFIKRALIDPGLRDRLNGAADSTARRAVIRDAGFSFGPKDFVEAMRGLEVRCQTLEDHQQLQELRLWWDLLQSQ